MGKIDQGAIYEIPLDKDLGYGYVQVVLPHEFANVNEKILIYPLNLMTKESLGKSGLSEIDSSKILMHPHLMLGYPSTRGINRWRLLGTKPIDDKLFLPDFKECQGGGDTGIENEAEVSNWCFIRNLYPNDSSFNITEYNNVKHLGMWGLINQRLIQVQLTMAWLKKLGLEIELYFNQQGMDILEAHWIKVSIYQIKQLPFWEEIPQAHRGRAIETS